MRPLFVVLSLVSIGLFVFAVVVSSGGPRS
jgi:hypothetical protein